MFVGRNGSSVSKKSAPLRGSQRLFAFDGHATRWDGPDDFSLQALPKHGDDLAQHRLGGACRIDPGPRDRARVFAQLPLDHSGVGV